MSCPRCGDDKQPFVVTVLLMALAKIDDPLTTTDPPTARGVILEQNARERFFLAALNEWRAAGYPGVPADAKP